MPSIGTVISATVPAALTSTVIGSCMRPLASARSSSCRIARSHRRRVHVRRLDDHAGRERRAGKRALHPFVRLHCRERLRERVRARARPSGAEAQETARATSSPPERTAQSRGRRSTRSMTAPQIRPSPSSRRRRPTNGTRARSTPSPSLESRAGSTVSEPSIAIGDHDDRGNAERVEDVVAGQEHAGHRDDHGQPGDEHRAAGGRGRDFERGSRATACGTFLALAPQVEHRIVDADREPDQQHQRGRLHRHREDVLGRAISPKVANTAVSASSSGMPAATSAPNASTRMPA